MTNFHCKRGCTDQACPAGTTCHEHDDLGRPRYHNHPDIALAHTWLAPGEAPNTSPWTCCALCGTVQRNDGRPQSACRGPVRVALRSVLSEPT